MRIFLICLLCACSEYELKGDDLNDGGEDQDTATPTEGSRPGPDDVYEPTVDEVVDQWNLDGEMGTDILFFGDTSGSMAEELTTMGDKISVLIGSLSEYTDEWQMIAVTGPTGCAVNGVLTPDTPDYETLFSAGLQTPPGEDLVDEWGLYNAQAAVEDSVPGGCNDGFIRDDARLHVIFISDEDDNSPGWDSGDPNYWQSYVDAIYARKGNPDLLRFSGVVGPTPDGCDGVESGWGYADAIEAWGGTLLSICGDWDTQVQLLVDTTMQYTTFNLSHFPNPDTLEVFVNGDSVSTGWSYDRPSNSVVFDTDIPTSGDEVEIFYLIVR